MGIYSELNAVCAAVGIGTKDLGSPSKPLSPKAALQ